MTFSPNMTLAEAYGMFFLEIDGKSEEEKKQLSKEFQSVLPQIVHNEVVASGNSLTSYALPTVERLTEIKRMIQSGEM